MNMFLRRASHKALAIATLICCTSGMQGGDKLHLVKSWLKQEDNYMYLLTITSAMKMHPEQKLVQSCTVYNSKSNFIRYMHSDENSYFINKQGMMRCNNRSRVVQFKQFTADSIWQKVNRDIDSRMPEAQADSLLFWKAEASSKMKGLDILHFELSHPRDRMIRDMQIDYNLKTKMVETFDYVIERATAGDEAQEAVVVQHVHMDNYRHAMPDELVQLIKNAPNLRPHLEARYQGYKIQKL
jgi:hypothetical protein